MDSIALLCSQRWYGKISQFASNCVFFSISFLLPGKDKMAKFLLERGANPNVADENGLTAYKFAIQNGEFFLQLSFK